MPKQTRFFQHGRTLLEIAQQVHAAITGAGDPAHTHELDIWLLSEALKFWENGPDYCRPFDNAVLALITAVVQENRSIPCYPNYFVFLHADRTHIYRDLTSEAKTKVIALNPLEEAIRLLPGDSVIHVIGKAPQIQSGEFIEIIYYYDVPDELRHL